MASEIKDHWEKIYNTKQENEVSWFQSYPATSMEFVAALQTPLDAQIIDIGGGDSHFVDALLQNGYQNIWVLDISANAIERAKKRLGANASKVNWIVSDITSFEPPVLFDLWHDRAAFHFLTTEENIQKYVSIADAGIKPHGHLVLGTFSETGPEKCSGLEITRYSEASMSVRFEAGFEKVRCISEDHTTPFHTTQRFVFCSFRKR